jgi:hypothetical protein
VARNQRAPKTKTAAFWQTQQVAVLAVVFLVAGLFAGYLLPGGGESPVRPGVATKNPAIIR